MNELELLKQKVEKLEKIVNEFYRADRYYFKRNIDFDKVITIQSAGDSVEGTGVRFKGKYTFFDGEFPVGKQGPLTSDPAFLTLGGTYSASDLNTNFGKIVSWNDDLMAGLYNLGLFSSS